MIFDTVLYSEGAFTISELRQISVRDLKEIQDRMGTKAEKQREALNPKNRKVLQFRRAKAHRHTHFISSDISF